MLCSRCCFKQSVPSLFVITVPTDICRRLVDFSVLLITPGFGRPKNRISIRKTQPPKNIQVLISVVFRKEHLKVCGHMHQ